MGFWDVAADFFKNLFSFDQAHPLLFTQFYFWALLRHRAGLSVRFQEQGRASECLPVLCQPVLYVQDRADCS